MRRAKTTGRGRPQTVALVTALILGPGVAFAEEAGSPLVAGVAAAEPTFTPGIPGVKMVDVRDHKFLWREIDELQRWEHTERISIAEYRSKAIEKTVHFLQLDGAVGDQFVATASTAVAAVRTSFRQHPPSGGDPEAPFSSDLATAVTRVSALLDEAPRHQLFAPHCKKWLLKLAFGPNERKEAKQATEAKQVQADPLAFE